MTITNATKAPQRWFLMDVDSGDIWDFPLNPEVVSESVAVNYSRAAIAGMSHEQLQYSRTGNIKVPLRIILHRDMIARDRNITWAKAQDVMMKFVRFVQSLTVVQKKYLGQIGGSPPSVYLSVPELLEIQAKVTNLGITYDQLDHDYKPIMVTVQVELEEHRESRYYSEDVREFGTRR